MAWADGYLVPKALALECQENARKAGQCQRSTELAALVPELQRERDDYRKQRDRAIEATGGLTAVVAAQQGEITGLKKQVTQKDLELDDSYGTAHMVLAVLGGLAAGVVVGTAYGLVQ